MMMMAAAQAAAEANTREAAAEDQRPVFVGAEEIVMANLLQGHDPFHVALATQDGSVAQHLFNEMIAGYRIDESTGNMQPLLQMMAQQEQEQLLKIEMEAQLPSRPTTHYLTVANDGKWGSYILLI